MPCFAFIQKALKHLKFLWNIKEQEKFWIIYLLEIYRWLPNLILMNRFSCLLDAFSKHQQKQSFFLNLCGHFLLLHLSFTCQKLERRKKKSEH